jgi:hypothetical protein
MKPLDQFSCPSTAALSRAQRPFTLCVVAWGSKRKFTLRNPVGVVCARR